MAIHDPPTATRPETLRAALASVRAHLDADEMSAALAVLKRVLSVAPLSRDGLLLSSEFFWRKRQFDRAQVSTRWLAVSAPGLRAGWDSLSALAARRGAAADLVIQQRRAEVLGGERPVRVVNRLISEGRRGVAGHAARALLCRSPGNGDAYLSLARASLEAAGTDHADRYLRRAAISVIAGTDEDAADQVLASVFEALGRGALMAERPGDAHGAMRRAALLCPVAGSVAFDLGRAAFELGDVGGARRALRWALAITPNAHVDPSWSPRPLMSREATAVAEGEGYRVETLAHPFKVRIVQRGDPGPHIDYPVPATFLARLDDAALMEDMQHVITPAGIVLSEGLSYRQARRTWDGPHIPYVARDGRVLATLPDCPGRIEGEAVLLGGGGNYYHCLVDWLSRLPVILGRPELATLPVLVSGALPPAILRVLEILGLGADRLRMVGPGMHAVDRLWIPSLAHGRLSCVSPRYLEFLENRLFRRYRDPTTRGRRRLYIARGETGHRGIANGAAVEALLERHGFETVHMGALPVEEQFRLAADAEIIIGAHGAGLANILAAPAVTPVIELTHARALRPVIPILAGLRGQPFHRVTGQPKPGTARIAMHAAYEIPLDDLTATVRRVLAG